MLQLLLERIAVLST